jgi:hypothetical protein
MMICHHDPTSLSEQRVPCGPAKNLDGHDARPVLLIRLLLLLRSSIINSPSTQYQ